MTVYSASQFFNELDLLEIKLETMSPYVDFFIISESTKTHSGRDKPLYYLENKERYKKFNNKIIHQIIDDSPSNQQELFTINSKNFMHEKAILNTLEADWFDKNAESYLRDTYEKECLIVPLNDASDDDIILLGDLDEIIRPESLESVLFDFDNNQIYHFKNEMFYYYLNLQKVNEPWSGMFATSVGKIMNTSFCKERTFKQGQFIDNGGWHFTSIGNIEHIKTKIESWGEQSLNTPMIKDNLEININNCVERGMDMFFRPASFTIRDIDDGTFPEYVVNNKEKFLGLIKCR